MSKINTACTSENEYALQDAEHQAEIEQAKEWAYQMSREVNDDEFLWAIQEDC